MRFEDGSASALNKFEAGKGGESAVDSVLVMPVNVRRSVQISHVAGIQRLKSQSRRKF